MSADHETNKQAIRRLHDVTNTGDLELISKTIDELFEPDALIRTPLPIEATGAQAVRGGVRQPPSGLPGAPSHDRGFGGGGGRSRQPQLGYRDATG